MSYNPTLFIPREFIEKMVEYTSPLENTLFTLSNASNSPQEKRVRATHNYECIKKLNKTTQEISEKIQKLSSTSNRMVK